LKALNPAGREKPTMQGRFLDCTLADAFSNVALEEVLFRTLEVPVLRVWDNQRSVVIGRAQLASIETDLDSCRKNSIPVVRRFTAGGAVYNGPGNVNWSFLEPSAQDSGGGRVFDAKGVFVAFAGVVVRALAECSADCRFEPPNRIVNDRGKVSGMAAYLSSAGVICHGTLLLNADLREVEALTKPARARADGRYARSTDVRVANCGVDRREFVEALLDAADVDFVPDSLGDEEAAETSRLLAERYSKEEWNLGDPFRLDDF
jgi:lipoate-protein ligase A